MNSSEERRPSPATNGRVVGRVAALWRYPVKSMGGEMLDAVDVSWHGLVGDRRWAFLLPELTRGCPWLTMSKLPTMGRYMPRFVQPSKPDESPVVVRTPSGIDLDVADPALAAELGDGVRAVRQASGLFDVEPLSILSTRTVADLGGVLGGGDLDMRRFRPNIVVESDEGAYPEDGWLGAGLRIGGLRLRVDQRIERCVMVNVDPVTSERDPAVLRAIASTRDVCLGIYAATAQPGRVAIGDLVTVEP